MINKRFIVAVDKGGDSWGLYVVDGECKAEVIKTLYDWLQEAKLHLPPVETTKEVEEDSPQFLFSLPVRKKENNHGL